MTYPTISINICTYNAEDMLSAALDCMIGQETDGEFSFEIVVVDDGSADGVETMVKDRAAGSPAPVRYVRADGKGVPHARNVGIGESRGEWIAWFDQDQTAGPSWLKELYCTALASGAHLVDGPRDLLLPEEQLAGLDKFHRTCLGEHSEGDTVHKIVRRYGSCTGNAIVKRSALEDVGGFDESILNGWEDWDFVRRFRAKGYECWYAPGAMVHHVVPPERLDATFFEWYSLRVGVAFASRDRREWGMFRTVLACVARLGQAVCIHVPVLAAARLTHNEQERSARRCLLLRTAGYLRETLFFMAPRLFAQAEFHERLQLRAEPKYLSGQGAAES